MRCWVEFQGSRCRMSPALFVAPALFRRRRYPSVQRIDESLFGVTSMDALCHQSYCRTRPRRSMYCPPQGYLQLVYPCMRPKAKNNGITGVLQGSSVVQWGTHRGLYIGGRYSSTAYTPPCPHCIALSKSYAILSICQQCRAYLCLCLIRLILQSILFPCFKRAI